MIRLLSHIRRPLSLMLIGIFLFQLIYPSISFALTSGPTQPEVQSFQPAGTSDMVDLFSGDFSYNIPLFELPGPNGGYPFNLSYQAGVTMDQEASWVGLGWSLQPGAITRQVRGLPDEFKGDMIHTKMSIKPNVTIGVGAGAEIEIFGAESPLSLGVGLGFYHNNYKGMGYTIDATLGLQAAVGSGMTGGLSLGLSLDSKEGASVNPSLSLGTSIGDFGLNTAYHSRAGLQPMNMDYKTNTGVRESSPSLSFASPGYTPQVTMPMKNISFNATVKIGGSFWGVFGNGYVKGFYTEQWLENDKKRIPTPAFGYLNYQYAQNPYVPSAMLDFNREKDGMVTKEIPNLAIPSLTYDVYSVSGQGIGLMYRPYRNDYGVVYDKETVSKTNAFSAGVDIAPAASHIGVNLNVTHAESTSGRWSGDNEMLDISKFQTKKENYTYEPWYFKVHGEPVAVDKKRIDSIGADRAVRVRLSASNQDPKAEKWLEYKQGATKVAMAAPENKSQNNRRGVRNHTVQSITNGELLSGDNKEMIPYYSKIKYINAQGQEQDFVRTASYYEKHHIAGYTALNAEGLRYVYGIPAYNLYQEDVAFSTKVSQAGQIDRVPVVNTGDGDPKYAHGETDSFLKRTELPPYAHSYLLTSIVGPDYVDVTNDGVTADDLGYWVKFTYRKTTDNFQWRDPFSKAHFSEGWRTDPRDDRGNFTYGKKELWYLAKAETKSHVAVFSVTARQDGRGVQAKLQDSNNKGESIYRLNQIKLYTRTGGDAVPIKVVKFDYDYSLCQNVDNNDSVTVGAKGKLTLKKLWFEYGGSSRGSLNPYKFSYHDLNPSYDVHAYDRWGSYKSYTNNEYRQNHDFPYLNQSPENRSTSDNEVASWSLSEIELPSGGTIKVAYEADDYAYVQQKQAMEMVEIVDPYTSSLAALPGKFELSKTNYKIRFKLKSKIPYSGAMSTTAQRDTVLKYIDQESWQLYFKLLLNLRSAGEGFDEYICGYADISNADNSMGLEKDNSEQYTFGYFHVKGESGKHPFSMRAYQHIRTNQPDLANSGKKLDATNDNGKRIDQIKGMVGMGAHIRQLFEGFYDYCEKKNWGRQVTVGKSWVRLNSVTKKKVGGGLRVKQITMDDNWTADNQGVYGQIYDYTTTENGKTISSGVAAFEPFIGGDENALRYAKKYVQSVPLRSNNNLFYEYPANESNYPGPQVGYRKVTVMSLASAALAGRPLVSVSVFPTGAGKSYGTTGKTTHEFYTAKDFPVITDETDKENRPYKLSVPIPLLGSISVVKLAASQGYSIITNDMHGKPKEVRNFRQSKTGVFETEAISWIRYNYRSENRFINGKATGVLLNEFVVDNGGETLSIPVASGGDRVTLGQEHDFFYDMREYDDNTWSGGVRFNTDILFFLFVTIPVPIVWPSVGYSKTQLRTAVTNKIVYKTGVLESVEAFDGGSLVRTRNLKWDKQTGQVVLTSVNNNFDQEVFSYTRLAFREYQGMGAAYQNIGLRLRLNNVQQDTYKPTLYHFTPAIANTLYKGDELLLYSVSNDFEDAITKVVYIGERDGSPVFHSDQVLSSTSYKVLVVRSGYRNQLTVAAGSITSLTNPTLPGTPVTYSKTIRIPKTDE